MLAPRVYRHYDTIARYCSDGTIIELGAGQGASTIALARGIRDAGRAGKVCVVDQFCQDGDKGPHPAGTRKFGSRAVGINIESFWDNIRRYEVEDFVEVYVGKTDEVENDFGSFPCCDVLVIDVDGYVNRDLSVFYNYVVNNGIIIIDDCVNIVNRRGHNALRKYRHLKRDELLEAVGRLPAYQRARLLGKHVLTYRLVELFRQRGLLVPFDSKGATVFFRKNGDRSFGEYVCDSDIQDIERSVVKGFEKIVVEGTWRPWTVRRALGETRRIIGRLLSAE
jgi:predicted O-methyltransferase YrrM